jgi:hypothetical protein
MGMTRHEIATANSCRLTALMKTAFLETQVGGMWEETAKFIIDNVFTTFKKNTKNCLY